jgi:hypothetical protein
MPLLKNRTVPLPTWQGGLLLLALCLIGIIAFSRAIVPFLALNAPLDAAEFPAVDVLVIEGWAPDFTFEAAAAEFKSGRYQHIASIGGHIPAGARMSPHANFAEYGAANLLHFDIDPARILTAPARDTDKHRTYQNALGLRETLDHLNIKVSTVQIISTGAHARRTLLAHRRAFGPEISLGIIAFDPEPDKARDWWRDSESAKKVISETVAYVHDRLSPPEKQSAHP